MKICDLHVHSNLSDGTYSPEEVVRLAKQAGLAAVALTDHNSIDGLERFLETGEKYNIETVPGIEISTEYNGVELHVVCLCVGRERFSKIKEFLSIPKTKKEESNRMLALKLCENGYEIDYEELKKTTVGLPNRVHFARALVEKGYIKTIEEGFDSILSEGKGLYLPPKRLTTFETLEFINSINAVSILAHPLLDLTEEELLKFLPQAVAHGLDGMEVRYSTYSEKEQEFAEKTAKEFGLLASGGSDFHGENKPDISLGLGKGNLQVPYEFLEKIKARKEK
jgi:predicted metal-dependent phosphoesterase TrpH